MDWQPIETAPRDGTSVLLVTMDGRYDGFTPLVLLGAWVGATFDEAGEGWLVHDFDRERPFRISAELWQPLPEPPEVE